MSSNRTTTGPGELPPGWNPQTGLTGTASYSARSAV
jgi:hypothetical protein